MISKKIPPNANTVESVFMLTASQGVCTGSYEACGKHLRCCYKPQSGQSDSSHPHNSSRVSQRLRIHVGCTKCFLFFHLLVQLSGLEELVANLSRA